MGVLCLSSQHLGGGKLGDPGIQGQPGLCEILFKINKPEVKKVWGGGPQNGSCWGGRERELLSGL